MEFVRGRGPEVVFRNRAFRSREGGSRRYGTPSVGPAHAIFLNQQHRSIDIKTNVLGVLPTFSGRRNGCPYEFLNKFSKLCSIQKRPNDANEEDYRLRAVPFDLKGEANTWLLRLPPDSINTSKDFKLEFLDYFFPSNKTNALIK